MKPKETNFQTLVDELYSIISNKDLTDFLIESFVNSIQKDLKNEDEFLTPEEISSKLFIQHSIIKFFNQLNELKKRRGEVGVI
jgi:hypothetical protein